MTPEQRLDRAERILTLFVSAGSRARKHSREQDDKINILIQSQMETTEQIKRLAANTDKEAANTDKEIAELRRSLKLTQQTLRAFINSLRKGGNGKNYNPQKGT